MSYILEALKKSERERSQVNIATLQTTPQVVFSNRSLWIGMLIGGLALAAVAALAWFVNLQLARTDAANPVPVPAAAESSAPEASPAQAAVEPAPAAARDSAPAASSGTVAAAQRVSTVSELDPAAREKVQSLSLNVVSYSKVPERRFIMVNQRIVRESETVGDGIVVKRILPEGALLGVGPYEVMVRPE